MTSPSTFPRMPGRPVLGNLIEGWQSPIDLFMHGVREHGEDVCFRFLHLDYLLLTKPESVHHVLVSHADRYAKSANYDGLKFVLGHGLLTSEGSFWRRQRKLVQPAFHRNKLASFTKTMANATLEASNRWLAMPPGTTLDLHAEFMRLTFRIVGLTLLSQDLDGEAHAVGEALSTAILWANSNVEAIIKLPPWVPTPGNVRFTRARRTLDGLVLRLIEQRRQHRKTAAEGTADVLDMLLEVQDADTGEQMSDEQIKHELLTLVLAGHETTANALSFLFYQLARHPEALARARDEAHVVLGDRPPAPDDLKRLEYITALIEESMRLYPPAWSFERQALVDDEIGGLAVKKGTTVGLSPYVVQRSPRYWREPERFDPERFLAKNRQEQPKYVYMPFGGGQRICIGNQFAMMEMQIIVALLIQRCEFELDPSFELEVEPLVTLRPKGGINARVSAVR